MFFNSIILGSLYHGDHLSRAVYARITELEALPPLFHLNRPLLSGISNPESRQPGKAPNFSVNWGIGDEGLEVITAMQGKTEQGQKSRLCKQEMFKHFSNLYSKISSVTSQTVTSSPRNYTEAKSAVMDYQITKQQLFKAFQKAGLGNWVKKPVEQDQFDNNSPE